MTFLNFLQSLPDAIKIAIIIGCGFGGAIGAVIGTRLRRGTTTKIILTKFNDGESQ
jgi:hypothetical protein